MKGGVYRMLTNEAAPCRFPTALTLHGKINGRRRTLRVEYEGV